MSLEPQYKKVGVFHPKPGQKVWELDTTTGKVREAEIVMRGDRKTINHKAYCMYECAINKKNAERKFGNQLAYLQHVKQLNQIQNEANR